MTKANDLQRALGPRPSWRARLGMWFYSTRNIAGCALAIVGVGLHLAGILTAFWVPAVLALYAIGVLLAPSGKPRASQIAIDNAADATHVKEQLDRLVEYVRPRLAPELMRKVESIRESIETILPRTEGGSLAGDPTLYSVRQTALDYLPSALSAYLSLPAGFATTHKIDGKQTAAEALDAQLTLLDSRMKEVVNSVLDNDSEKLLAHGRFLQQRFGTEGGPQELTLGQGGG